MIKNFTQKFYILTAIVFGIFFVFAPIVKASTEIYFKNEMKEVFVKDNFSIDLMISSPDKSINVIDGTIIYDKDKLEIKKIKIDDSLFSLWTKEPIFDNETGELSFVGGIPNGFIGKDGQVLEITFSAKKDGITLVGFKDIFSVFLNDGMGTQINPWLKPLSLSISEKPKSLAKNTLDYLLKLNKSYRYYALAFLLVLLFIIIRVFIKLKNKKRGK